uniref:Uncharacterized protein n=1 Tax=Arundo donax TaxID=35708 RepID=A0A0A9ENJ8_ARUDO
MMRLPLDCTLAVRFTAAELVKVLFSLLNRSPSYNHLRRGNFLWQRPVGVFWGWPGVCKK